MNFGFKLVLFKTWLFINSGTLHKFLEISETSLEWRLLWSYIFTDVIKRCTPKTKHWLHVTNGSSSYPWLSRSFRVVNEMKSCHYLLYEEKIKTVLILTYDMLHIILLHIILYVSSVQFSHSLMSNSLWPMDCSTPGLPVHHQLLEFTQTHVHWVSDAIQPSPPLLSPSLMNI